MSDFYIGDLTPGTFVVNVSKEKEWGIGQVQSCINNTVSYTHLRAHETN